MSLKSIAGFQARQWWGSLDSTPRNFDFMTFLTFYNYTQQQTSQRTATISKESSPQSKNRFCQDNKLNNATPPSCPCGSSLISNSDDFEDSHLAQQISLTIWQSLLFSILQHDAIGWIWLSGQLMISNPVTITLSDLLSRTPPDTCMTAVDHCHYHTRIPIHYFSGPFRRFHTIQFPCGFGTAITKD